MIFLLNAWVASRVNGSLQGKWPHLQKGMDVSSCSVAAPGSEVPGGNLEALINVPVRENALQVK